MPLKFQVLIEAGADVNVVFPSQVETEQVQVEGVTKTIHLKSYPGKSLLGGDLCCLPKQLSHLATLSIRNRKQGFY